MTTLTTILGLVPMLFAGGEGSEIRQPLAATVIGGLTFGTILTLVVLPIIYRWVDRGSEKIKVGINKLLFRKKTA
jgi:HAE1 family hydrophobic/amphiphilic exporter-1